MTDELRRFIVDSHEVVNVGLLERYSEALHVVGPKFNPEDFLAAIRGVDGVGRHAAHVGRYHQCGRRWLGTVAGGRGPGTQSAMPFRVALRERSGKRL